MTFTVKKTATYLKSEHEELSFIFTKVNKLAELNASFLPYLPIALREYCQIANISNDNLVLLISNAAVAMELRFMTDELLQKIKHHPAFKQINEIKYKIRPLEFINSNSSSQAKRKIEYLSKETANIVKDIADTITDPALRKIMQRIAEHRK